MRRITKKDLDRAVLVLNNSFGFESEPYGKNAEGKFKPNPNVYHLDYAYGRVALDQMMPAGSGVRNVLSRGTRRELYEKVLAFTAGAQAKEPEPF